MADKSGDSPKEGSEKVELLTPEKTKDDSDIEQLTSVLQGLPKYARHRKRPSLQEVIPKNVPVVVLPDRPASDTENDAKDSDVKNEECRLRADSYSKFKNLKDMSLFEYLKMELTQGYILEHDEAKFSEKRRRVYTFMTIPKELEKFMTFGFLQCADAFLYVFTFLPLRFLMALFKFVTRGCVAPWLPKNSRVVEPAQVCDLLKGIILIGSYLLIQYVDVSMMYHIVRGQAIIKLYIFFNMLEVADKLFSSFGQDILDALLWTATEPRGRKREHIGVIPHLLLAIVYVVGHAILVLFQATCLNVAFNSHNKALLTIMMSNNFVELKGSVFKKFEKNNLFQMSCSDVRERFHFVILLMIVCVRNMTEFSWNMEHLWVLIPDVLMVLVSEMMVDWVKHAFITKFNEIPAEVYKDYNVSIAYDMAQSRQKNAFSDLLDVVSRRMGFIPLPLGVLLVRVLSQCVRTSTWMDIILVTLTFLCLLTLKVLNSIILLGLASDYIQNNKVPRSRCTSSSERQPANNMHSPTDLKRSKSVGSDLNLNGEPELDMSHFRPRPSFSNTPRPLFTNSTVSLASMSLNEDLIAEENESLAQSPVKETKPEPKKEKKPSKPLHEIDRKILKKMGKNI